MRIWSLHPKYLDAKGIVALWREALLARNVLYGNTKGYTRHPQLIRFKESEEPIKAIHYYLQMVWEEAQARQYRFDASKFESEVFNKKIPVTTGQVEYESRHLLNKLRERDVYRYSKFKNVKFEVHPLFLVIEGDIEKWEKA